MKELKGMFQIIELPDDAPDDAVKFDSFSGGGSRPRPREELVRWGKTFADRLVLLLLHWNSRRLEREALAYALRWDGSSKLAAEVDVAFEYCLAWMEEVGDIYQGVASRSLITSNELGPFQALELMRHNLSQLLMEARSRAEFLAARAADIRISGDLQKVADALLSLESEQLADKIATALEMEASRQGAGDLARLVAEHPELEKAASSELERFGRKVEEKATVRRFKLREWIIKNGSQVAAGVAGNAAYALLKSMFPGVVP